MLSDLQSGTKGVDALVAELHTTHRTTQADIASVLSRALYRWSIESLADKQYDARNERAIRFLASHLSEPHCPYYAQKEPHQIDDSHLNFYTC